jgi:hypothetical protein
VNWRVVGCGTLAIVVFLAVGVLGMSMAFPRIEGCPERLQWGDRGYLPDGSPAPAPSFAAGPAVEIGSTFFGLTTRRVWGPPGSAPSPSAADRPGRIFLDCDNGRVQAYQAQGPVP